MHLIKGGTKLYKSSSMYYTNEDGRWFTWSCIHGEWVWSIDTNATYWHELYLRWLDRLQLVGNNFRQH